MKRDVEHRQINGGRQALDIADVHALEDGHARILAEGPGKLAVPDVEGNHRGRAAAKQDVGESTGARAGVEAEETDEIGAIGMEREGDAAGLVAP